MAGIQGTFQQLMQRAEKELAPEIFEKISKEAIEASTQAGTKNAGRKVLWGALSEGASEAGGKATREVVENSGPAFGQRSNQTRQQFINETVLNARNKTPDAPTVKEHELRQKELEEVFGAAHKEEVQQEAARRTAEQSRTNEQASRIQKAWDDVYHEPTAKEHELRQKELEAVFGNDSTPTTRRSEVMNPDGTPKTAQQKAAERQAKLKEANELKQKAAKDNALNKKHDDAFQRQERATEAEELKERGVVGKVLHKVGGGVEALFGHAEVKTDASGAVTNSFASRKNLRKEFNQFLDSQFVQGGLGSGSDWTFEGFKSDYRAIRNDMLGNFGNTNPYKSGIDTSGILGWAMDNPWKTAGIIAATTVGAAGLMSRRND